MTLKSYLLKLLLISCCLLTMPYATRAHRFDIQATTFGIHLGRKGEFTPAYGLGIGYDFRKPYNRPGWSFVSSFSHLASFYGIKNSQIKGNSVNNLFLPSVSARYRYYFNRSFAIDFNIGAMMIFEHIITYEKRYNDNKTDGKDSYHYSVFPQPFIAVGCLYSFNNDIMLGMNISALYQVPFPLLPLFNLYCSLPVFSQSDKD